jgi:preprotein translocase subunit YajC
MTIAMFPALAALLQAPAPAPGGGSVLPQLLFQFGLIFAIFYFLMIRPQQKQRKNHENALKNIKRGDKVVTAGGVIGDVIHVKDSMVEGKPSPLMDDEVTIKSGETRLIIERGRIAKITSATAPATT